MAKNTHSQEVLTGTSDSFTDNEIDDPSPPYQIQRAMLGELTEKEGDEELAGTDSSELSLSEQPSSVRSKTSLQEHAQMTGNPSNQTGQDQEDSSARSTDGGGRATARQPLGRKTQPKSTTRGRAQVRITGDDEDEFS